MGRRGHRDNPLHPLYHEPALDVEVSKRKQKRTVDNTRHRELCLLAGKWLRQPGRITPPSCPFAAVELVTIESENPDVFGWNYWATVLIEVKVSRSDFFADRKKPFRIVPQNGVGDYRFYCCPNGMIRSDEVPDGWGLLYEFHGKIAVMKEAERVEAKNTGAEMRMLASIFRREGIKPQLFDYRHKK